MKKLILFLAIFVHVNLFAQSGSPVDYLAQIGEQYEELSQETWKYVKTAAHSKRIKKIEKKRLSLIETTYEVTAQVKKMPPFEGDSELRDSVVSFLERSYYILTEDYGKIVDLEEVAEESYDLMEAYINAREQASDKMNEASDQLQETEKRFAEKHNITLMEDDSELSENLEIASEVNRYYNDVYLIFFKSYKQELYIMDALERQDLNAIQQNADALKAFSEEGIASLDTLDAFANDNALEKATIELLEFYLEEVEDKVPVLTDFLVKNENFGKIQSAFEQIKPAKRTQDDVDNYNNAVNELNEAVENFNKTNEELNDMRNSLIENWNKVADKYLDAHVPK